MNFSGLENGYHFDAALIGGIGYAGYNWIGSVNLPSKVIQASCDGCRVSYNGGCR